MAKGNGAKAHEKKKVRLNIRQGKFIVEYLRGSSGAEAARRAGYGTQNARQTAHEILTNPHVQEVLKEELKKHHLSREEVVSELEVLAISSIKELWNDGRMMHPNELPDDVARTIRKFKAHPERGVEIEMHDKLKALAILCKLHGLV